MRNALIIPNRNGAEHLDRLLPALAAQSLQPDEVLVVDSASNDDSPARWREFGARVVGIAATQFNHGGTRRWASTLVDADVLIYMTQDAVPADRDALRRLHDALFAAPDIGVAYGRQLPHPGASLLSAAARAFNYPPHSRIKRRGDARELGIKTCFNSDAFAAYRRDALAAAGGFPADVIGTEDTYVAARMLLAGYAVHYAADAQVHHSHEYTPVEEMRRYFDIGTFYRRESWIGETFGHAGGEGLRFVRDQLDTLAAAGQRWRGAEVVWRSALKLAGYKLGFLERHLPSALKRRISMFPRYWKENSA